MARSSQKTGAQTNFHSRACKLKKVSKHQSTLRAPTRCRLLVAGIALSLALTVLPSTASEIQAQEGAEQASAAAATRTTTIGSKSGTSMPANHRMEPLDEAADAAPSESAQDRKSPGGRRNGRQYDVPMGASGSVGNYASYAGDSSASGAGYASSGSVSGAAGSGYSGELSGSLYSPGAYGQASDQMSLAAGRAGYPMPPPPHFGAGPLGSMFPSASGGLLGGGGGGSMFPLMMAKGFDVSEIVCTAIAVAIGAVIVGAPFILLYLFIMNQMQGANGGPSAMGPGGGSISLTGPTSSTNVSGRKKRHTSLPEALFRQLSPLVNSEQVAQTFKALMNSISHYQS